MKKINALWIENENALPIVQDGTEAMAEIFPNINIIHANSAFAAIVLLEQQETPIDLIIMEHAFGKTVLCDHDTIVKEITKVEQTVGKDFQDTFLLGFGIYHWLRSQKNWKNIPIVFFTNTPFVVEKHINTKLDPYIHIASKDMLFSNPNNLLFEIMRSILPQITK